VSQPNLLRFIAILIFGFLHEILAVPLPRISGSISLPGNLKAPSDIGVQLIALTKDYDGPESSMDFEIPAGKNSVAFSISVPSSASRFRLRFFCPHGGWMRNGYYSSSGTVPFRADRPDMWIDVSRGDVSGLNLVIPPDEKVLPYDQEKRKAEEEARAIARSIVRPYFTEFEKALAIHDYLLEHLTYYSDAVADSNHLETLNDIYRCNGLRAGVVVCNGYASLFVAMASEVGLETRLVDMANHEWNQVKINGRFWHVDLSYNDHTSQYGIFLMSDSELELESGYSWAHPPAANRLNDSFPYSPSMTPHLSEIQARGYHRFFGTIRLPPGEVAPAEGIVVWANEEQRYFIAPGKNSAFFVLRLPKDGLQKNLRFSVASVSRYIARTWFTAAGALSYESKDAIQQDLNNLDHNALDVTLIPGLEISGTIRLPPGMVAPPEGVEIGLDFFTEDDLLSYFHYKIPAGGVSVPFSERVPEERAKAGVIVRFNPSADTFPASGGYYNASSIPKVTWEDASRLHTGRESLNGLVLQLQRAHFLSGRVTLPPGMITMTSDFEFKLGFYRYGENGSHREWSKPLLIKAGERSVDFRFRMTPETGVREYRISVIDTSGRFLRESFFSRRGLTSDEASADSLSPHCEDTPGINFVLQTRSN